MRMAIFMALIIMLVSPPAFAKIEQDGKLPKEAYGARVLSVGYRYNWRTNETEIRVKVQKNKQPYLLYFSGEHLPMGASMVSYVGKKINLSIGEGGNLLIIGFSYKK
jgi:hypothetical protein